MGWQCSSLQVAFYGRSLNASFSDSKKRHLDGILGIVLGSEAAVSASFNYFLGGSAGGDLSNDGKRVVHLYLKLVSVHRVLFQLQSIASMSPLVLHLMSTKAPGAAATVRGRERGRKEKLFSQMFVCCFATTTPSFLPLCDLQCKNELPAVVGSSKVQMLSTVPE